MFYNDFGVYNPPSFGSNSVFQKPSLLVFRTFRELRDSKKGKVKEHGSEFLRRMQWAEIEDQEPNQLGDGGSTVAPVLGCVGPPRFALVAPMPSIIIPLAPS